MNRRQDDRIPQFDCGIPIIDRLGELTDAYVAACAAHHECETRMFRCGEEVLPVTWTKRIENAVGDDAALESLRIQFDELSITFLGLYHVAQAQLAQACDAGSPLNAAIKEAIEFHDSIESYSKGGALKPLLRAAVAVAAARAESGLAHRTRGFTPLTLRPVLERAEKALRAAYEVFLASFDARAAYGAYPTEPVVEGRKLAGLSHLASDVDLRAVSTVALRPHLHDKWPSQMKLFQATHNLEKCLSAVKQASHGFRSNSNGSVNEMQHASRLIDAIHGATCFKLDKEAVEAQNLRRMDYELAMQRVKVLVANLTTSRAEAIKALAAAVTEAEANNVNPKSPCMITWDWKDTSAVVITNILAADCLLREIGRDIQQLSTVPENDLSHGAGKRAVDEAFKSARLVRFGLKREAGAQR